MTSDSKDNVTITNWDVCYNGGDDMIVLSCEVATNDSSPTITGVGILLNQAGATLATSYVQLSNGTSSATPSLNLTPGKLLRVGDAVTGVVTGEADNQHFFFEEELVIGTC